MLDDDNNDLLATSSEIYKDRLYFVTFKRNYKPKNTLNTHYFCIDDDFVYENFYNDFGPLNICMLYRYCQKLSMKLTAKCHAQKKIVHYTSMVPAKRLNSAYLIGSYAIIYLHKSPEEVHHILTNTGTPAYTLYCDASYGPSNFKISLLDCLNAVYKGMMAGFYNFDDFDAEEYEYYERVENGDFNWIIPQKFIAFCGPHQVSKTLPNGYPCHSPQTYFDYFRTNNVTTVVRLNAKVYHAVLFENAGFEHKDLFFVDGSTPSDVILRKFLTICETTTGAIAVHCKAGLGRTGSLIGAYIMKHYNFSALEAIAWLRLCRPGSVIGHQQQWMEDKQAWLWSEGERMRKRSGHHIPVHIYGIYSLQLKEQSPSFRNAGPAIMSNENTEILPPLLKGISQRVDTMHLHDRDDFLPTSTSAVFQSSTSPLSNSSLITTTTPTTVGMMPVTPPSTRRETVLSNGNRNKVRARSLVSGTMLNKNKLAYVDGSNIGGNNSGMSSISNSGGSASDVDNVDGETDLSIEDKSSTGTFIISPRRRKSPNLSGTDVCQARIGGGSTPSSMTTTHQQQPAGLLRRTSPVALEQVLFSEKKVKKPPSSIDLAPHHKHTIASTVKMSQAAIERKGSQTQGDKLNQIKAMRRQHNSRAGLLPLNNDAAEMENPLRYTRARSQPFRNNNNNIVNMFPTPVTGSANPVSFRQLIGTSSNMTTDRLNNDGNNHNNINNNNNNNINTNASNASSLSMPTSTSFSNVITTRARSLAIYSKRMGLMHLRQAEGQQQRSNDTTTNASNGTNMNNNNNNNNGSSNHHQHHDVTTPTLSSLNKQTKTHNNTLLSCTTTANIATPTTTSTIGQHHHNNSNNNNNNINSNNNIFNHSESRIPVVRSLATLADLATTTATTTTTTTATITTPTPTATMTSTSLRSGGRGSAGGGHGTVAILGVASSVVGSAATIPPVRGSAGGGGGGGIGGGGGGGVRAPSHHHMTLRGRSRVRFQQRQSSVESVAPPCTTVTARYYRDVSAIPTISGNIVAATNMRQTLDLNSNPVQERFGSRRCNVNANNTNNNNINNNNNNNNGNPSASDVSDPPTPTNTTINTNTNTNTNNNTTTAIINHPMLHTNFASSGNACTPPPPDAIPDINRLRGGISSDRTTPTTTTGIPVHYHYYQQDSHQHQHHHHHHHHNQQQQQPPSPSPPAHTYVASTKRNKRSLSSTRLGKDKCDEYNTKLLRKTTATMTGTSTTSTTSCGGSFKGQMSTTTTTTSMAILRRPALSSTIAATNILQLESSTASTASSNSSASGGSGLLTPIPGNNNNTTGGSISTTPIPGGSGQRHGKYTPSPITVAVEREQQQQQMTLKLRKKISY